MTQANPLKWLFITVIFSVLATKIQAQNGTIQGVITDENGIYVPGANVILEDLKKGDVSDFDGRFTILSVPEGTHKLTISFLGYEDVEQEVNVSENETEILSFQLKPSTEQLNEVEIIAYGANSQAKALNKQKNNINITNVVSTDQIGKFPDANIGDAVKRIPGITMQVDQGEARNIIVRGLSPQLNSVTLNGSRIPSAEGDNRNVQMDLIPSDMIQTIEVNKAVTPDMDADALGGSVNLITRTAPQDFRLSASVGSGINFITDKRILNGSVLVGDRTENKKFGWMLSASINDTDFGSDNVEAEWSNEFEYNTGVNDADGEAITEEIDVNPYVNEFQERTYLVQRIRRSFSANLDYQFNPNHNIYLKTMYNWRDDRENRLRLEYKIADAEDQELGDFTITNGTPVRFRTEVARQTKGGIDNNRNKNTRLEDQRMQNYSLGGDHVFGNVKMDWLASYAKASEERLNERYAEFDTKFVVLNSGSAKFPLYTPENQAEANNLSNFEINEITEENQYTDEKDTNFFLNFELPSDFFGNGDGIIKFGARGRFKEKERDNNFFEFKGLNDVYKNLGAIPTRNFSDADYLAGSQYQIGSFVDPKWLGQLNLTTGGVAVPDEYLRSNFNVKEDVWAGYVMANQKLSDKLNVLVGVRLEATKLEATGFRIKNEDEEDGTITKENSYTNVLPGVHFKYDLNDRTVLRLAWTNTIARPNYVDLTPSQDVISDDEEIFVGNPDLDPATSMNLDLIAEHYFKSVGVISGGLFYKDIKDFAYTYNYEVDSDIYGENTTGFDVFQPLNGDKASVFGFEVAFQRQLDFLPSFAKNFSIYLNYTYLTSDAKGIRNEDGDERDDLDLPNTAPHMFNGSLGYNDKKFSARLSANFSDAYLDELGGNAFEDRYYDKQFFLDFNIGYAFSKNLRIFADFTNLTDQPLRYYQGESSRTMQTEYYGRKLSFGIKYDLFNKK